MEIYNDFQSCPDEEVWRKSKRVAEDASGSKGSALASGAYSKRNRSALDDITNEYLLLPEQPDRMVTRSSLRAAQAQAAQAACQGVPAAWKCPQTAGDSSDRSRGIAEQRLAAHSQQAVGPPTPRRLKKIEVESRASAPAVHVESWSQRWAAPRDTSNAMVLSPAEGSVGGISQRLSDRLGVGTSPGVGYEAEDVPAVQPMEFEQDALHANNPQYCVDYVHEIFEHLIATENKLMPSSAYMDTVQNDINPVMRGILVDWLVEVAEEYKLTAENLYLSTNYVDRFLSTFPVMRGRLQLVGVTCMFIASKYEEIFAPRVEDFVYITDSTYSETEVLQMEVTVLNALRFNLTAVTPYCFLKRLTSILAFDDQCRHLSEYLAEITIQEFAYLAFKPSQIAGSAICLALHTLHLDTLPPLLRRVFASWGMDMDAVRACARDLHVTHTRIYHKQRTLQASFEKYSHNNRCKVSLMTPRSSPPFA